MTVMTPYTKKTRTVVHMTALPEYKHKQEQKEKHKQQQADVKFVRSICGTSPKFNFFASGGNNVK